jgi:hypothetical protein
MSPWELVLVAAGSALAGSLCVVWFARPARGGPTHEGPEQRLATVAPAILMALADAPRAELQRDTERSAYVEFLVRVEAAVAAASPGRAAPLAVRRAVGASLDVVVLVAPADVVEAAQHLSSLAQADQGCSAHDVEHARTAFLNAARGALKPPPFLTPAGGQHVPDRPN